MTEAEWETANDPTRMLEALRQRASSREFRLFACACCRRIGTELSAALRDAVDVAESFATGMADEAARQSAYQATHAACSYVDGDSSSEDRLHGFAAEAVLNCLFRDDDYPAIPTYAATCAIAAAAAVVEVVGASAELRGEQEVDCERHVGEERRWQCAEIRNRFRG